MLLFFFKTFRTLRRAIAGRRHPHQLAWAIAFGLLLGVIPHGNLVALGVLLGILCLNLNHAAMGLTALATSFFAAKMDPASHRVGDWVLRQSAVSDFAERAWQWPMVPWTDLNNTIVVGSLLIGLAALIPVFMIMYPLCRMIMPKAESQPDSADLDEDSDPTQTVPQRIAQTAHPIGGPHLPTGQPASPAGETRNEPHASHAVPEPHGGTPQTTASGSQTGPASRPIQFEEIRHESDATIQTRVDLVRMTPNPTSESNLSGTASVASPHEKPAAETHGTPQNDPAAMDEALNYLLRQLRDTHQGDAA